MQSDTRIFVFRLRQLLTALAVAVILILTAILAVFQFIPSKKDVQTSPASAYTAGIYTSSITLGSQSVDIQVVVDKDRVKSASIVNLDESVAAMYPLLATSMDNTAVWTLPTLNTLFPGNFNVIAVVRLAPTTKSPALRPLPASITGFLLIPSTRFSFLNAFCHSSLDC